MSGKATLKSYKSMIADAKLPERTHPVCLRGDLVADHEAAVRELELAEKNQADSLVGAGIGELVDRIEALEAEMRENSIEFRLRSLPKRQFRALVSAHPPRRDPETNELVVSDRYMLINYDTFFDALLKASVVEPELDEDDWLNLLGHTDEEATELTAQGKASDIVEAALTDRQWDKLTDIAWGLNRNEVDIPFSLAASRAKRSSAAE